VCMACYECSVDEVASVFGQRVCIDCGSEIVETPRWTFGSPPAGVRAVVSCDECGQLFGTPKHRLKSRNVDFSGFESM